MSSKSDDPERLLAEALRAQAVSTPVHMPPLPKVLLDQLPAEPEAEPAPEAGPETEDAAPTEAEPDTAADDEAGQDEPQEQAEVGKEQLTEEMMLEALTGGPTPTELATIRIEKTHHIETERFSPVENVLGPMGSGPGFGLLSGSEVGSSAGLPLGEHAVPARPADSTTTRMPAQRAQLSVWMILLIAVALGLAAGAVAALLSMV